MTSLSNFSAHLSSSIATGAISSSSSMQDVENKKKRRGKDLSLSFSFDEPQAKKRKKEYQVALLPKKPRSFTFAPRHFFLSSNNLNPTHMHTYVKDFQETIGSATVTAVQLRMEIEKAKKILSSSELANKKEILGKLIEELFSFAKGLNEDMAKLVPNSVNVNTDVPMGTSAAGNSSALIFAEYNQLISLLEVLSFHSIHFLLQMDQFNLKKDNEINLTDSFHVRAWVQLEPKVRLLNQALKAFHEYFDFHILQKAKL